MRKIEQQMVQAILDNKEFWQVGNTRVQTFTEDGNAVTSVFFHGNLIARVGEDFVELRDCGWRSNTLKSRLNAILNKFGANFDCIFQKDFQWFFHDSLRSVDIPFESGMVIA
jgi:hypothetical protein